MRFRVTIIFIALFLVWMRASGQNNVKNTAPQEINCKASKDLINTDLFGVWVLELQTNSSAASNTRLTLQRNPEFKESLAGQFTLGGVRHEVFGDIEEGAFDLEESSNGKDIIAIWKGRVQEGSCGQAITGKRRLIESDQEQSFLLRRAGW
jgi:hypothetical protein